MGKDLDGISEHEKQFEVADKLNIKRGCNDIGGFSFLLSLLVVLYTKAIYHFKIAWTLVLC
jgi:hypothetical protein